LALGSKPLVLVLALPIIVGLKPLLELIAAGLKELDISGRVDSITKLGIAPLGKIREARGRGGLLCRLLNGEGGAGRVSCSCLAGSAWCVFFCFSCDSLS